MQSSPSIEVLQIGRVPYQQCWQLQKQLQTELIDGSGRESLICCEHEPVITIGKSGSRGNILVNESELTKACIEIFETERGGDITYHGPGQLLIYPIIDLRLRHRDVGWYMRSLEETSIRALARVGLNTERIPGRTGVWLPDSGGKRRKIAAIGVRISRWCTMHGMSVNVQNCSAGFSLIKPCGYDDIAITSIAEEIKLSENVTPSAFAELLIAEFLDLFNLDEL